MVLMSSTGATRQLVARRSSLGQARKFGRADFMCLGRVSPQGAQQEFGSRRSGFAPCLMAFEDHPHRADSGAED